MFNRDYIPVMCSDSSALLIFRRMDAAGSPLSTTHPTRWELETNTHSNKHTLADSHRWIGAQKKKKKGCGVSPALCLLKHQQCRYMQHFSHINTCKAAHTLQKVGQIPAHTHTQSPQTYKCMQTHLHTPTCTPVYIKWCHTQAVVSTLIYTFD